MLLGLRRTCGLGKLSCLWAKVSKSCEMQVCCAAGGNCSVGQGPAHQGHSGTNSPPTAVELSLSGRNGISSFPCLSQEYKWQFLITEGLTQRGLSGVGGVNQSSGLDVSLFRPYELYASYCVQLIFLPDFFF